MPMNRKLLGAAAFSLALAGGGAAGAILGTPNLTLAQDAESGDDATEAAAEGFRATADPASSSRSPPRPSASPRRSSSPRCRTASRSPRSPRPTTSTSRR